MVVNGVTNVRRWGCNLGTDPLYFFPEPSSSGLGEWPGTPLYQLFAQAGGAPESPLEEFELFRVMYHATNCHDLNTTLQKDPNVKGKREAVQRTMAIIARTLDEEPRDIHLTIGNYGAYIA